MSDNEKLILIQKIMNGLLLVPHDGGIAPRKGTTREACYRALYEIQELFATWGQESVGEKNMTLCVKLDDGAFMPDRAHGWDGGLDIKSPVDIEVIARGSAVINTGVHITIPVGCVGLLKSKSGLNVKKGIQSEGLIDAGYTGAMVVKLYNHSDEAYRVLRGDKISQLVIVPCWLGKVKEVDEMPETERGENGFGSTGR